VLSSDSSLNSGAADMSTAVTKFKSEGVTTLIPYMDFLSMIGFTNNAASEGYFPEILINGGAALDNNAVSATENQAVWSHAFGFTTQGLERRLEDTDCYRAYRSIDPSSEPSFAFCTFTYDSLYQLMTGMQQAGP